VRASDKIFIITSTFYISYMEAVFVIAKIIGSPSKIDRLKFYLSMIMTNAKL